MFKWLRRWSRRAERSTEAARREPVQFVGNRTISLPERDAFDVEPAHLFELIPAVVDAYLVYTDRDHQQSRRNITTRGILDDPSSGWALSAYCHLRQAGRTFLVSRIDEFVDLATGEVVHDVVGYLKGVYARSPQGLVDAAVKKLADEISVLVFLARADGRLTGPELLAICGYVSKRSGATLEPDVLQRAIRQSDVGQRAYVAALKRLKKNLGEGDRAAIVSVMQDMLAGKKSLPPFSEAALKSATSIL